MAKKKAALFSSKNESWETPIEFFQELDREFHFTLDPCADETNHKCAKYYTAKDDGLTKNWRDEIVFCNPPYGRKITKWVKKCHNEVKHGGCPMVVMLLPARTDTQWFHQYIYKQAEIIFLKGRLRFVGAEDNAPFPSMVVVMKR